MLNLQIKIKIYKNQKILIIKIEYSKIIKMKIPKLKQIINQIQMTIQQLKNKTKKI